jgi:hypothetical protein
VTRSAQLAALTALAVVAGCGGTAASDRASNDLDREGSVVCSGKPRYCAETDTGRATEPP